ncbi:MAG: hypothetical protein H6742_20480, partial [Alphaproteobacteria bacterium]|nr:hypothetical protein [Alphaproteobacteria bacterium]
DLIHFTPAGYVWSAERFLMAMEDAALKTGGLPGENMIDDWRIQQAQRQQQP